MPPASHVGGPGETIVTAFQNPTKPRPRPRRTVAGCTGIAALLCAVAAPAWSQDAAPVLHCDVRYMSDTVSIQAEPTAEPYKVVPHDIGGRFGFKAVVVGDSRRVDHVALYAYDLSVTGAPVLIHQVVHHAPFDVDRPVPGLTGWNHVYSSNLGREMVYGCAFGARPAP